MSAKNIDHNRKVIFLHPNKCGGKSVEFILFNRENVAGSADHRFPGEFIRDFGTQIWNEYFKFGFARNPWDRMVSSYNYRVKNLKQIDFGFSDFILHRASPYSIDYEQQIKWFYWFNNPIDFIGRVETYQQDWDSIRDRLNCDIDLPHLNKSERTHYSNYYNAETKDAVYKTFNDDIKTFGYEFEDIT